MLKKMLNEAEELNAELERDLDWYRQELAKARAEVQTQAELVVERNERMRKMQTEMTLLRAQLEEDILTDER